MSKEKEEGKKVPAAPTYRRQGPRAKDIRKAEKKRKAITKRGILEYMDNLVAEGKINFVNRDDPSVVEALKKATMQPVATPEQTKAFLEMISKYKGAKENGEGAKNDGAGAGVDNTAE